MSEIPQDFSALTRIIHWLNAISVLALISSGWAIYNAAPFYPFEFPKAVGLGGGLTGALRWHFAFMWVFAAATLSLIVIRVLARRGGPRILPLAPRGISNELHQVLRLRLRHEAGIYLNLQRMIYLGLLALFVAVMLSGLALWKPVQLQWVADGIGGYEIARRIHFWSMAGIAVFVVVHLTMVALVPSSLIRMGLGVRLKGTSR